MASLYEIDQAILECLDAETWKQIPGFEGLYDISDHGCVRNARNGNLLKLQNSGNGYFKVNLSRNGVVSHEWVHRLVAKVFVPNPHGFRVVDHVDGNKKNNHANNLEWVTSKENAKRAYQKGLMPQAPVSYGEVHPNHILTERQVFDIRILYTSGVFSQRQLAKQYGVSQTTIKMIVNNRAWKEKNRG